MNTQFKNVRYAIDRIDSLFTRLRTEEYDTFTADEQAIIMNPMGYLATMFQMDDELWGEDLMYSLATLYKPSLIMGKEITIKTNLRSS